MTTTLRSSRAVAGLIVATLLAACSGGGSTPPRAGGGGGQQTNSATVHIKIAGTGALSRLRKLRAKHVSPKYVSVATNGIAIYVYPSNQGMPQNPTAVADVSASSKYCTVDSDGSGDRTCAVPLSAPGGSDDFTVDGYDQPPSGNMPAGNLLEVGTALDVVITPGQPNTVNLTFDGEVASITIAPPILISQDDGVSHNYPFAVNAFDSDGYTIIGSNPFNNPLTITVNNDPNKTLTIDPPPSGTDPRYYEVTYNGTPNVTDAQIVASDPGIKSASVDFTPMIVSPQSLTITKSTGGTITAQMAVPAGFTENPTYYLITLPINGQNCSINGNGVGTEQMIYPSQPGAPIQITITEGGSPPGGCTVAVISPGPIFALLTVTVTYAQ